MTQPISTGPNRTVSPRSLAVLLASIVCGFAAIGGAFAQDVSIENAPVGKPDDAKVSYQEQIVPMLQKYCTACHVDDDASGGLSMETFAALMRGGEHGPAFTAGVPASSRLLQMSSGALEPKMPPDDMEGMSDEELKLLAVWIEQGAVGPSNVDAMPSLRTPVITPATDAPKPITAMSISADGRLRAIGRFGSVEIRNIGDDSLIATVADLPGKVHDVRFLPDGKRLVIGSGITGLRGTATVVETESGTVVQALEGHRDTIFAVAVNPTGTQIATAGYDAQIVIWDVQTGDKLQTIGGHNGAIFDLAYSIDGGVLASASADETVKLWEVATGKRLDTLSQPQGEVRSVCFSPDDRFIVAASSDQRVRVWQFESRDAPDINPLLETRYADESPLVRCVFAPDGSRLVVGSQSGNLSVFETDGWTKVGELESAGEAIAQLSFQGNNNELHLATLDGRLLVRELQLPNRKPEESVQAVEPVYLVVDSLKQLQEPEDLQKFDRRIDSAASAIPLPRGAVVKGTISPASDGKSSADWYRFRARRGEVWVVETNAARMKSPLDSIIEVRDTTGDPVTRARLQAVRRSYFTFRGKDSRQTSDFRLFGWEEMRLNDYLYSSGEVTRLWMYPRGPDSGFNVYPGTGTRTTYFDSSPITHALQEPAYVVRPLEPGETPVDSGLPVFEIYYANDDDSSRQIGSDSRLTFTAPYDGEFTITVDDTRRMAGDNFRYELTLRPSTPDFQPSIGKITKPIPAGSGREFRVSVLRKDGYDGPVEFEVLDVPDGLRVTSPLVIEAGQSEAFGVVWVDPDAIPELEFPALSLVARSEILGRTIERDAGLLTGLKVAVEQPQVAVSIFTLDGEPLSVASAPLVVRRGETVMAEVRVERNRFENDLSLGKEFAGRNLPHGAYVDNIGLSGLLVPKGQSRRQFFITADQAAQLGERLFHLKAEVDGGITSLPVRLRVVPSDTNPSAEQPILGLRY